MSEYASFATVGIQLGVSLAASEIVPGAEDVISEVHSVDDGCAVTSEVMTVAVG